MAVDSVRKTSPASIAIAWVIVVVPTLWGLNYTVQNAMKLFAAPAPAAVTAPATPAAAPAAAPAAH